MSLTYGVYLSVVGVSVVFAMLLAIALASEAVRRIFPSEEKPVDHDGKLLRVAAIAATYYYMGSKLERPPRRIVSGGQSNWSAVARMEALETGVDHR